MDMHTSRALSNMLKQSASLQRQMIPVSNLGVHAHPANKTIAMNLLLVLRMLAWSLWIKIMAQIIPVFN
jgi:hypothetical protein